MHALCVALFNLSEGCPAIVSAEYDRQPERILGEVEGHDFGQRRAEGVPSGG